MHTCRPSLLTWLLPQPPHRLLQLLAGETSFFCRRPGRLAILSADSLPPHGTAALPRPAHGYAAELRWPPPPALAADAPQLAGAAFLLTLDRCPTAWDRSG